MLVGSLVFGLEVEVAFIGFGKFEAFGWGVCVLGCWTDLGMEGMFCLAFVSAGSKLRVIETFGRLCLGGIEMPLLAFTTTGFGVATLGPEIWTPLF